MPTNSSNPIHFNRISNNSVDSRTGANWKAPQGGTPTAKIVTVGMYRPDHNKQYNIGYYGSDINNNLADANAFRARPMKHYRKQYGNTNNKQTNRVSGAISSVFEIPGGSNTKVYTYNTDCTNINAPGGLLVPDYALKEINQFNMVGRSGNSTSITFDETKPKFQSADFYDYKSCMTICDPVQAARKRVQSQTNINRNPQRPKYYQTAQSYLHSRCKTIAQSQMVSKAACSLTNDTSCQKTVIYKPNNTQYSTQGAVSASSRLTRLKLNTIQRAANATNGAYNLGQAVSNALAYSGRPEAPFTAKSKYQNSSFYKNFHISRKGGQGNHTTACFTCDGGRITDLQQQSKSIRTSGIGSRTLNGVV